MVSMLLIFGLLSGAATASDNISPEAGAVLKAMSDFLGQTKAFSADADIDFEVVSQSGQKFQLSSSGSILMKSSICAMRAAASTSSSLAFTRP